MAWAVIVLTCLLLPVHGADQLVWRMAQNRVDVQIDGWDLPKLLEEIAAATGWQVYFEPGTALKRPISARFKNVPTGDALNRLMGDLSYTLLPGENGHSRLMVFKTALEYATKKVHAIVKNAVKAIPNERVVVLKPGNKSSIEELAAKYGAKITGRSDTLNAYRLKFSDEGSAQSAQDSLLNNGDISSVDFNYPVDRPPQPRSVPSTEPSDQGLKLGPVPDTGGVIVGLIDTAVQLTGGPYDQFLLTGISVAGPGDPGDTVPSHGTSMMETLLKGAYEAQGSSGKIALRILPVDVYGNAETTSTFDIALGIKAAIDNGATIINISSGGPGDSQLLHDMITQAFNRKVPVIGSAGNQPTARIFPGAYPEVISVGAIDPSTGEIASYSSRGPWVDMYASGTAGIGFAGQNWVVTGTSPAAASVSGLTAGLASKTGQSPFKAVQALESYLSTGAPKK